jgi:hypothetical protein
VANNNFDQNNNGGYRPRRSHPLIDALLLIYCIAGWSLLFKIWLITGMPIPLNF